MAKIQNNESGSKQDNEEKEPSTWRRNTAWGLLFLGAMYLALAGFMMLNADTCVQTGVPSDWWARRWAGLTCMTANEMGDMLAGVFAPLAFLGLVIAILLQGQDLELQRADQDLTRKVMKAQAKEARRSAEYIGTQTRIIEEKEHRTECWRVMEKVDLYLQEIDKTSDTGMAFDDLLPSKGVNDHFDNYRRLLYVINKGGLRYRLNQSHDDHEELLRLIDILELLLGMVEQGTNSLKRDYTLPALESAIEELSNIYRDYGPAQD